VCVCGSGNRDTNMNWQAYHVSSASQSILYNDMLSPTPSNVVRRRNTDTHTHTHTKKKEEKKKRKDLVGLCNYSSTASPPLFYLLVPSLHSRPLFPIFQLPPSPEYSSRFSPSHLSSFMLTLTTPHLVHGWLATTKRKAPLMLGRLGMALALLPESYQVPNYPRTT
jgi:hypothetical protein